ncbi:MAG: hypothetical protein RLZZ342_124 [Candidatus Parcubacteria bacterium]|jgi:dihydroorotase
MSLITVSGRIASHAVRPFWGRITMDSHTGLIVSVEKTSGPCAADYEFGHDRIIFAGFGDVHIHAREDDTGAQTYKEKYKTAADAALHGGVVHVSAMPNTPNPLTGSTQFSWHRARVSQLNHPVSILNYIGIDKNTLPIGKPGEHMYKLYFGKSVGSLTVTYASELEVILRRYRGHHISFHVEYEPIVQASAVGKTHSDRRPVECVNEGLRLLLPLIEKYGIKAKLCHWSTGGESFDLIKEYRKRDCHIELEVSPLHLLFDSSMTDCDPSLWMKVQMNPAIQGPQHRADLIAGLRGGFINMLATDHAPHTLEEKHVAFAKFKEQYPGKSNEEVAQLVAAANPELFQATCCENNTSGAPWLDTYALVCVWLMHEHDFAPQDIARVAAYNPGRFVNRFLESQFPDRHFGHGFGEVKPGFMGSLTVLNLGKQTTVLREDLKTKVGWSPLEGRTFSGALEAVFIAGVRQ